MKGYLIILLFFICSCQTETKEERVLAKVGSSTLYPSMLLGDNYTNEELENITKAEINDWIHQELWYNKAKQEITNEASLEQKVERFKKSLYISTYKDDIIKKNNVFVGEDEIIAFFKKHEAKYINTENQYKIQYVTLDADLGNLLDITEALNSNVENTYISDYCENHKDVCLLKPTWVTTKYLKSLSLPEYLWTSNVNYETFYINNDRILLYRITEKRNKGELMPLEQVSQEIISILEFQKSKKILDKKENEIILNAQKNNEIEIYP